MTSVKELDKLVTNITGCTLGDKAAKAQLRTMVLKMILLGIYSNAGDPNYTKDIESLINNG